MAGAPPWARTALLGSPSQAEKKGPDRASVPRLSSVQQVVWNGGHHGFDHCSVRLRFRGELLLVRGGRVGRARDAYRARAPRPV